MNTYTWSHSYLLLILWGYSQRVYSCTVTLNKRMAMQHLHSDEKVWYSMEAKQHNANAERVFSPIRAQWTDERNRLSIDSVRGAHRSSDNSMNRKHHPQQTSQTAQQTNYNYQQQYPEDYGTIGGLSRKVPKMNSVNNDDQHEPKKAQASNLQHSASKYSFPVKRLLLTRDPKDRSVGGNGLGMRIIGGKEIPGTGGQLGAFVTRIYAGGVAETLGDIREGDQVLEWNGISLTEKTFEDVQKLISQTEGEIEIVVKR